MCKVPGCDAVTWQSLSLLPVEGLGILRSLIESRLNCDEGHYESLAQWCRILAVLIPKVANPTKVGEWRPISLTSVLQKLYLAVVQQVCEPLCSPLDDALYGFRANCQTGDISEAVRVAVQKRLLHNHPGYFLKADAFRVFDSMRHCKSVGSLRVLEKTVRCHGAFLAPSAWVFSRFP